MKVVLTSTGSRGDVQPMLAIAQALAARGHHATIAAPPDFDAWVRRLGFAFVALGSNVQAFLESQEGSLGGNPVRMFQGARRLLARELPSQMATLMDLARDADAIVFAGGSVTAPSVAQKLGKPVLGVLFTSCLLPSPEHAPVMIPWRTLPKWMNRLLWGPSRLVWNRLMLEPLNIARACEGMPPVRDLAKHLFDETAFVLAADGAIMRSEPEWAAKIPAIGFLFIDEPEKTLDPRLDEWLRNGEPPIYVGFGSMTGKGPERMRRVIVEAIASTGRRALVSRGWARLGDDLPSGWHTIGETPHALLFRRVACVVHHGGSGTTASALRAGVPQVLVPLILDQYHHAQRLCEESLAPRPIAMERITAAQLGRSIAEALASPAQRRLQVAERLRRSRAADLVADRLEQEHSRAPAVRGDAQPSSF